MIARPALFLLAALLTTSAAAEPAAGQDFSAEVKLLFRVVTCTGDEPLPAHLDAKEAAEYCKALAPKMKSYKEKYVVAAKQFIGGLRPAGLPTTVVYPFGGGDLISALTTYPDATDLTTLSLEHVGDPRRINTIEKKRFAESLLLVRKTSWGLLMADNSTTENLQKGQRNDIPGELAFFLLALSVHGYEPVGLRYFQLNEDGTPHYLTAEEIAAQEKTMAKTLRGQWSPPDQSVAFSNMELTFRERGNPNAPLRVHRHFAADLSNNGFDKSPALAKYLEAKGRICAMTKAASYLLWRNDFSKIRDYLLGHMEIMISDSTGIPPHFLAESGFEAETFGKFTGSFLEASDELNKEFRELWNAHPVRPLPFRYGYIEASGGNHMMIARKAAKPASAPAP